MGATGGLVYAEEMVCSGEGMKMNLHMCWHGVWVFGHVEFTPSKQQLRICRRPLDQKHASHFNILSAKSCILPFQPPSCFPCCGLFGGIGGASPPG